MSHLTRDRVEEESRGEHRGRRGRSAERQVQHNRSRSRSPPQRPRQQRYIGGVLWVFSWPDVTLFETGMQIDSVKHVFHFYFKTAVRNTLKYYYYFLCFRPLVDYWVKTWNFITFIVRITKYMKVTWTPSYAFGVLSKFRIKTYFICPCMLWIQLEHYNLYSSQILIEVTSTFFTLECIISIYC
jgi:hypothetical protein